MVPTGPADLSALNYHGGNVNRQSAIALGVAVFIGLIAVYLANAFLSGVQENQQGTSGPVNTTKVVVAAQPIEYGKPLTPLNVKLVDWPANSVPQGALTSVPDATRNRNALQAIAAGEPIMSSRVTGTDGRSTLSIKLPAGQMAVAIPINDVAGVAGFVRPGDLVDVLLTRQIPGEGARNTDKMVDVIMQAVPVLAIDQTADKSKSEPATGKTATLQVDTLGAQKLALARELGTLNLGLRSIASEDQGKARTVLARDLSGRSLFIAQRQTAAAPAAPPRAAMPPLPPRYTGPTMTIYRKGQPTNYEVRHVF